MSANGNRSLDESKFAFTIGPFTNRHLELWKGIETMAKFMCTHTLPAGQLSPDQFRQFAEAAQNDPTVKGYRSFANLTEGKAICVMEAPDQDAVAAWFKKMNMPCDAISKVELEGECGNIQSA
jgi:hypothetical protein